MKALTLALLVTLLAGCANRVPPVWFKEGATQEQFARDKITCQQMGMQSAQANGLAGNMFVSMWINDEAIRCMETLGYTKQ